jgi:hypothetical protein
VAVQWLNEILCFVSSLVLAVRLVLRNRQLLVAATRYATFVKKLQKKLTIASRSVFFCFKLHIFDTIGHAFQIIFYVKSLPIANMPNRNRQA